MKERGIIFTAPMVRAILEGRKTQTRRVIRQRHPFRRYCIGYYSGETWQLEQDPSGVGWWGYKGRSISNEIRAQAQQEGGTGFLCPYGVPGDRLWVRENFYVQPELWEQSHGPQPVEYPASTPACQVEDYVCKPSIHMPRWASRITLKITDVRVERVQNITQDDAMAEGIVVHSKALPEFGGAISTHFGLADDDWQHTETNVRERYRVLWNSINGKRGFGWDENPWVYVITFKRVSQ